MENIRLIRFETLEYEKVILDIIQKEQLKLLNKQGKKGTEAYLESIRLSRELLEEALNEINNGNKFAELWLNILKKLYKVEFCETKEVILEKLTKEFVDRKYKYLILEKELE